MVDEQVVTARRTRRDPRRELTPQKLVAAARVVFERDGFHDARLADVTKEAKVSTGTLYNYFQSKEQLFRAVMQGVLDDLTERRATTQRDAATRPTDPVQGIIDANRSYVAGYRENARLMSLLSQVAERDPEVQAIGIAIRDHFETPAARGDRPLAGAGRRLQRPRSRVHRQRAAPTWSTASSPSGSPSACSYDEDLVAETLSKLWIRALGMARRPQALDARELTGSAASPHVGVMPRSMRSVDARWHVDAPHAAARRPADRRRPPARSPASSTTRGAASATVTTTEHHGRRSDWIAAAGDPGRPRHRAHVDARRPRRRHVRHARRSTRSSAVPTRSRAWRRSSTSLGGDRRVGRCSATAPTGQRGGVDRVARRRARRRGRPRRSRRRARRRGSPATS